MVSERTDRLVDIPGEGRFESGEFASILQGLVRQLVDGRLDLRIGEIDRSLWIEAGQVRAIVSEAEEEKLGSWLVKRGLLEPAQMALALLRQPEGVLFGTTLVEHGLVGAERLEDELRELAVALIGRCLFAGGRYRFDAGEKVPFEAATLEMTTATLLIAAVRGLGPDLAAEELIDQNAFVSPVDDAVLRNQRAELTTHEAFLLSRVDGTTTAAQLARVSGLPRSGAFRSLVGLVTAGLVEVSEGPVRNLDAAEKIKALSPPEEDGDRQEFSPLQQREYEEIVRFAKTCQEKDYYRRLGVSPGATYDQIHRKFRSLTELYHPDRAVESHLKPLRRELAGINTYLQEAYTVLILPAKRQRYDRLLRESGHHAGQRLNEEDQQKRVEKQEVEGTAVIRRAEELVRSGDIGAAVQFLDQTVRYHPDPRSLLMLARLEFRNPLWSQRGLDHLRRAVTVAPNFTEGWLELAAFWGKKKQPAKQRQCLERILQFDPGNKDAREALAGLAG